MVNRKIQILLINLAVGLSFQSCLDGASKIDGCAVEHCTKGKWVPDKVKFSSECLACNAWGDPHFDTFSGARFDWQHHGNTALAQAGDSTNPEFGVFMNFDQIGAVAYVGTPTTYQDDKDTKVVLSPTPFGKSGLTEVQVIVNRVSQDATITSTPTLLPGTSVYAWTLQSTFEHREAYKEHKPHTKVDRESKVSKLCVRLYGKSKILVELCDSIIHIWAPPKGDLFPVVLGGLCGSTDTDSTAFKGRKLVARGGHEYDNPKDWMKPAPDAFGDSWKALGKRKRSIRNMENDNLHMNCAAEAKLTNSIDGDHHNMCLGVHKGKGSTGGDDHLEACKYDLCIVANDTVHQESNITVDMGLELHSEIHARIQAHMHHAKTISIETVAGHCGVRNEEQVLDQSNVAYSEAQFGEFPWHAIIFFSNFTFKCGASLIGDRWLVTAAHCVNGFNSYDFKVRFGEWQLNTFDEPKPYKDVDVAAVTIHPQFNPNNVHNDIAVMQLVEPLAFSYHINTICLPSPGETFWGQRCIATGWGKDAFEGQYQYIMKKVELPTIEHHQCQSLLQQTRLGKFYQLDDSFMCAGGEDNKDACKGEGGGPLACKDPVTGQYVLTGITAFGIGCGTKNVPGVYADVQALAPFVQAVVSGNYDPNSFNH